MERGKRLWISLLTIIMVVTAVPFYAPTETVEAAESTYVDTIQDETVLVDNDFSSYPEYDEWLATQIFGEGNYVFGHGGTDATISIEDGKLHIVGDDGGAATDGGTTINRTQFLLASNEEISEKGVLIECEYTINEGTTNAFAFASKPIVQGASYIEANDIWFAGVYTNKVRAALRCTDLSNAWIPIQDNTGANCYTIGTTYNLMVEVTPTEGVNIYAKAPGDTGYVKKSGLGISKMDTQFANAIAATNANGSLKYPNAANASFAECLEDNVRLIVQCLCNVSIDNLKVYLSDQAGVDEVERTYLFNEDFDGEKYSQKAYANWLAEQIFGENNYIFGQGTQDATMYIEDGSLRIIGDNYTAPTDGRTQITKSQFLLSDNASISERGVVVEFDYTLNEGSNGYFALASKPLVEGASGIDANDIWISGIWANGYRTCLRNTANNNVWNKPGYATTNATYSATSTTYKIKIEALPQETIKLSAMQEGATAYTALHNMTLTKMINNFGTTAALFDQCFDDNVRLLVASNCDVTIDNLKITKANASEVVYENDFNIAYTQADYNEWLAKQVFGAGNYIFGNADTDAKIDIENGALRIVGVGSGAPTEGTQDNRTQFLLANHEDVSEKGVIVEYDYIYNTSQQAIAVASKPLVTTGKLVDQQVNWIAGVWNKGYRACLRGTGTAANWLLPGGSPNTSSMTYSTVGTKYNMLLEVTPTSGMKLSAKTAEAAEYGDPLISHSLDALDSVSDKIKYADCLDDNVRLIGYPLCDVTLDNIKVYLADQASIPENERTYLFNNDFSSYPSYSEWVAEKIVGSENYIIGQGATDATVSIEDGKLRVIGDSNSQDANGIKINRTQLLLASDSRIAERGAIIECDYIFNSATEAFSFVSKPLATTYIEQQTNWITCMRGSGSYQASLRSQEISAWNNPGRSFTDDTYSQVDTVYNLRIEVTPMGTLKMYAKQEIDEGYALLAYLTKNQIAQKNTIDFLDCLDGNIRLCVWCKSDVTFDNMKVTLGPVSYDANYDENVTIQDVVRMKKAIGDTNICIDNDVTDVDGDGSFDNDDIVSLREYLTTGVTGFSGGTYVDTYACGKESEQDYYTSVDSAQIDTYVDELRSNGYVKQQDNTIGSNRYVTLVGEKGLVHLTYLDYNQSLAVVKEPLTSTVYKGAEPKYTNVTNTSLAVMSLNYNGEGRDDSETSANGESFVITLRDGRYVIVDGGYGCDATALYNFLEDNNKRSDGIKVAAWFLSHAHEDHYGAFAEFANTYSSEVSVEYVVAAEGASSMYSSGYSNWLATKLPTCLDKFNAKLIRPHAGQILKFCDAKFRILYTGDNYINNASGDLLASENNASLVFQMIADGKTVLFTNDSDKQVSQMLVDMYGTNLKSNILQVNHHGRSGAIEEFVKNVNPTYSLWTTNQTTYELRINPFAFVIGRDVNDVADLQSHNGMQYLLTLMGDSNENCFVADDDVEIIRLTDYKITSYTPVFTTE